MSAYIVNVDTRFVDYPSIMDSQTAAGGLAY